MYNIDHEQTQRITDLKRWLKAKSSFWSFDNDEYGSRLCMSAGAKANAEAKQN